MVSANINWENVPLGSISDRELARQLGVDRDTVRRARNRFGVAASNAATQEPVRQLEKLAAMASVNDQQKQSSVASGTLQSVLFIPDCHIPCHDDRAWRLVLKVGEYVGPNIIVVLGDFCDFYAVSNHDRDPNRAQTLEREVCAARDCLDQLDVLGAGRKVFCAGNHEYRLERYLKQKAPALFNLVGVQELYGLDARGWEYHPYKTFARIGNLLVTHDLGTTGKYAIHRAREATENSVVIGHTHRLGLHVASDTGGSPKMAAGFGWLGARSEADYMHSALSARWWALGFGLGYLEPGGTVHLQTVPIVDYSCCVDAQMFSAM